jgi:hypothetical protein
MSELKELTWFLFTWIVLAPVPNPNSNMKGYSLALVAIYLASYKGVDCTGSFEVLLSDNESSEVPRSTVTVLFSCLWVTLAMVANLVECDFKKKSLFFSNWCTCF